MERCYVEKEKSGVDCTELQYSYFVSYSHSSYNKGSGMGMTNIGLKYPIRSYEDVLMLKDIIEKSGKGVGNVVILNYQLLEGCNTAS